MVRPKTRPEDTDTERYCGYHGKYESLASFTGRERTCKEARYLHHVRRTYGLTEEEYNALRGDGICPICRERPAKYVDHCHKSGRPRGVLCQPCNTALGAFNENVETFNRALRYLNYDLY